MGEKAAVLPNGEVQREIIVNVKWPRTEPLCECDGSHHVKPYMVMLRSFTHYDGSVTWSADLDLSDLGPIACPAPKTS